MSWQSVTLLVLLALFILGRPEELGSISPDNVRRDGGLEILSRLPKVQVVKANHAPVLAEHLDFVFEIIAGRHSSHRISNSRRLRCTAANEKCSTEQHVLTLPLRAVSRWFCLLRVMVLFACCVDDLYVEALVGTVVVVKVRRYWHFGPIISTFVFNWARAVDFGPFW